MLAQCPDPVESNATIIIADETCAGSEDGFISIDFVNAAGIYVPGLGDLDPTGGYRYSLWDASIGDYVYDDIGIAPPTSPINPNITIEFNSPNNIVFRNLPPNTGSPGLGYFIVAQRQDGNNCTRIYVSNPLGSIIGPGEPLPTSSLSGGGMVCLGDPLPDVTISFTGAVPYDFTYTVSGTPVTVAGHNSDTYTISNAAPGTYEVTALSDGNGCTGTDLGSAVTVTTNPLPVPTIAGPGTLCAGESGAYTTESGSGESNYLWDVIGGTITGGGTPTDAFVQVIWDGLGPYMVSVNYDNVFGCDAFAPTDYPVMVNPLPVPTISGLDIVCSGSTQTYTTESGGGESNYIWTVSGGTVISGGTGTDASIEITWNGAAPHEVTVSYTDANGCTALNPSVLPVTVNPLPVPVISGLNLVCVGSQEVYSTEAGAGQTDYIWSVSGGTIISGGSLVDPTVEVRWDGVAPFEVSVIYTDGNGCAAANPTVYPITVNPLPVPTISGPASVCEGTTQIYTTESGSGESGYSWTVTGGTIISGGTTADPSVEVLWDGSSPHEVSVNYTDANGCTATASTVLPVTVIPLPVPSLNGATVVCASGSELYSTDSTAGQSNFIWNVTGGTIISGGTPADPSVEVLWDGTAPYQVSISYTDVNGCVASPPTVLPVTVNPLPLPTITGPSSSCFGSLETYTTDSGPGISNYTWTVSGGTVVNGGTVNDDYIEIQWDGAGPFEVTVNYADANGCTALNPILQAVTVTPRPSNVIFAGSTDVCVGDVAILNITISGGTQPYVAYLSTDGGATIADSVSVPDTNPYGYNTGPLAVTTSYTLAGVMDSNGCLLDPSNLPNDVIVNVNPLGDVNLSIPSIAGAIGDQLVMPVTVQGFVNIATTDLSLIWDPSIIRFIGIENIAGLSGLDITRFNLSDSSTLTLQWTELSSIGQSLADGSTLFAIRYELIGPDCFSSAISFENTPVAISMVDGNTCNPNLTLNDGSINVGGSGVSAPPVMAFSDTSNCILDVVPELLAAGVNIQWYSDPGLSNLVGSGNTFTPLIDNTDILDTTFYATQIIGTCSESPPDSTRIQYIEVPSTSPIPGQRRYEICINDTAPTLVATGSNVFWYSDSGLTNLVGSGNTYTPGPGELDTSVADTTYFYIVQSNICGTGPYDSIAVHVKIQSYRPVVNSPTTVCVNDPQPILVAIGLNVSWYSDSSLTTLVGAGNNFTPDPSLLDMTTPGRTYFYVTQDDGCGESGAAILEVNVIWCVSDCSGITTSFTTVEPGCNQENGQIQITAAGGTGFYTYQLIKPDSILLSNQTGIFNNLGEGMFVYEIVDDTAMCITERDTVTLTDPSNIVATADTASFVNSVCYNEPLGRAIINVVGGSGTYEYSTNGNTWFTFTSGQYIDNLPPFGTYIILVRENASSICYEQVTVTINNEYPLVDFSYSVNDASCSDNDGSISVDQISGGLSPYEISFDYADFEPVDLNDLPVFSNLSSGLKSIRIQDANGCIVEDPNVLVSAPGSLVATVQTISPTCSGGGKDGQVSIFIDSALNVHNPPYQFGFASSDTPEPDVNMLPLPSNTMVSVDTLTNGQYYVLLSSATGCGRRIDVTVSGGPTAISFDLTDVSGIPCKGDGTGAVTVDNVVGDTTQIYLLELLSAPSGNVVYSQTLTQDDFFGGFRIDGTLTDQITTGQYQIRLSQNQSGCNLFSASAVFEITEPEFLLAFTVTDTTASYEDTPSGSVTIRIDPSGGDPYETAIANRDWEEVDIIGGEYVYTHEELYSGVYEIIVRDDYGCEVYKEVIIGVDKTIFIPNIFTPNGDSRNEVFYIRNLPVEGSGTVLIVTNRWGKTVFESDDYHYSNLWDGGDNPDGIYFYKIDIPGEGSFKGWVEIWRGEAR